MNNKIVGGRFQIIKYLGGGSFGQTYLASDLQYFHRQCVVKHLRPVVGRPKSFEIIKGLFEREATTLGKLGNNHPQIPSLIAYFEENQQLYLVQEFIEGHDLSKELIQNQKLSELKAIALLKDILEPLAFLHDNNYIHRDIKPSNLMRRQNDGKIVLIDFGAIKEVAQTEIINSIGKTKIGTIIGTPGYMPSEQALGKPKFASDLYAVGIITIQALTGLKPKELEDRETGKLMWGNLVRVTPDFKLILETMTAIDFEQRYRKASDVLEALFELKANSYSTTRENSFKVEASQPPQKKFGGHTVEKIPRSNRTQQILLDWVDEEVTRRLKTSLHNQISILLDKEENPSLVQNPWDVYVKTGTDPASKLPLNTRAIDVYERHDINGRLLILGAPGSGKTTTLLQLARKLIERAYCDSHCPIPILLNLSSWKDDKQSIKDWIINDLKKKYGVRKDIAQKWVTEAVIIPLLDGLDEVASARQGLCVEKINEFLVPSNWSNPLVICSRTEEYQLLTCEDQSLGRRKKLELNGAITLQSLTLKQIKNYLQQAGHKELWQNIKKDNSLMELAKTPLLLNILVICVISCEEFSLLKCQKISDSKQRLSYLFNAYIKRMLGRAYQKKKPKPNDISTQHWLECLATQLIQENQTEFFIEKIQPYWLKNKREKVIYGLIVGLIVGLFVGLFVVLSVRLSLELSLGLSVGLFLQLSEMLLGGLTGGIIGLKIETIESCSLWEKIKIGLLGGLLGGVLVAPIALIYWLLLGLVKGLIEWLIGWLIDGLVYGLIFALTINKIQTVESLSFSLKKTAKWLIVWLALGLILGMIFGLILGLMGELIRGLIGGVIVGLIGGLMGGLIYSLFGSEIELKITPNQGIKETGKNAIKLIAFPLMIFLITFLLQSSRGALDFKMYLAQNVAPIGFILIIFILVSTYSLIQHFSLRLVLWISNYAPWNYARFLDYATDRLFLQRVGGGYRFIHRLLQEHFAQMWSEKQKLQTRT